MGDSVRLVAVIGLYQWDQDSSQGGFCEITWLSLVFISGTRILLMGDSVRLLAVIGLYQWDQDSSHGGFCEITGCHWSLSVRPGFFSWGIL